MRLELPDRYHPNEVEGRIYTLWENAQAFSAADQSTQPPYCIILPPPNVTGSLHMGHALDHTIQDVLIRWKRMSGFNALWLPGTDHAGIATQSVVERELAKDKRSRQELGREAFLQEVWKWKNAYGDRIINQMKRLGDSCDWRRHAFTLDENVSRAVRKVFVELFKKGRIYRGTRLINWSPKLESAISDLEVEYQEVKGHLYHIRYPLADDPNTGLVVATTRPETLLGDLGVAVHPEDERYKGLVGKLLRLPLTERTIPILADNSVDREFGTGAVKITPAHDFNDYELGARHSLGHLNILNRKGTLNENAGAYCGLTVAAARRKVVQDLEATGLLVSVEPHNHAVGHCSRSGCVVEPLLSEQWFVKMQELAVPARRVVETGTVVFEPETWTKTYLHWLGSIQDWCISRQLWWGHRIPAWYCEDCHHINVEEQDPVACAQCGGTRIRQDEDVLDTWFSSALWPFSTLGWPQKAEALKTFYPTNVLVTGHDIIFFWVARMIMMGIEFTGDVPFRTVFVHGLIRDAQGKKMSKSDGNAVDPVEIIENYGADALRFTLMAQMAGGRDLKFAEKRLEGYRNFINKLWNAARFAFGALDGFAPPEGSPATAPNRSDLSDADLWITHKLAACEKAVNEALHQYRFSDAALSLYQFVWHEFCDWYLEFIKPIIYGDRAAEKLATQRVLYETLARILRLLHPFAPFVTEEIYQKLMGRRRLLIKESYPTPQNDKEWLSTGSERAAFELDIVCDVVSAIRNIRGENRIGPGAKIDVKLVPEGDEGQKILSANRTYIMTLARLNSCQIGEASSLSKCAVSPVRRGEIKIDVVVPLEGLVDISEEILRIEKLIEKLQKDQTLLSRRLENESFTQNAPPEIVEKDRQLVLEITEQLTTLRQSLARLQN